MGQAMAHCSVTGYARTQACLCGCRHGAYARTHARTYVPHLLQDLCLADRVSEGVNLPRHGWHNTERLFQPQPAFFQLGVHSSSRDARLVVHHPAPRHKLPAPLLHKLPQAVLLLRRRVAPPQRKERNFRPNERALFVLRELVHHRRENRFRLLGVVRVVPTYTPCLLYTSPSPRDRG